MVNKRNKGLEVFIKCLRDHHKDADIPISTRECSRLFALFMSLCIDSEKITDAMRIVDEEEKETCKNKD